MELPEENETGIDRDIVDTLHKISETTLTHTGTPLRSVHAKSHGLLLWHAYYCG